MAIALPSLTSFDPETSSEGTLDPLGLYLIADQLATRLVPATRERMQRIRFLSAMAVGAIVTADFESSSTDDGCAPWLVWEWLVVESSWRSPPLIMDEAHHLKKRGVTRKPKSTRHHFCRTNRP